MIPEDEFNEVMQQGIMLLRSFIDGRIPDNKAGFMILGVNRQADYRDGGQAVHAITEFTLPDSIIVVNVGREAFQERQDNERQQAVCSAGIEGEVSGVAADDAGNGGNVSGGG